MSGGSYDYLENWYDRNGSPISGLEAVADRLRGLLEEHPEDVALFSALILFQGLIEDLKDVEARFVSLAPVMHAIEWRDSCDWGEDRMLKAIGKWLAEQSSEK